MVTKFDKSLPSDREYKWLPFRFERLGNQQVAVTSMAGDWIILDDSEFEQLQNEEITSIELQDRLESRHIVQPQATKTPERLLALKIATRNMYIAEGTALHIIVVTLRCEHACEYCQVSRQNSKNTEFDMTEDDASAALSIIFQSPSQFIKIEFQGGESLLAFDLIKFTVLEAKQRNVAYNKNLSFVIATNLAVVTDEMLDFMKEHEIFVSTSLDGSKLVHNTNRARPGRNSWELAVSGIERVRVRLGHDNVSALMTTTEVSLRYPKQIIDTYVELGFSEIFIRHLSPFGHAVKSGSEILYDNKRWIDFYFECLSYIIELNRGGVRITELLATTYLTKMLSNQTGTYVDLATPSGAGLRVLVYNYDGDIYISDEGRMLKEMNDSTFRIGNVQTHNYLDLMTSEVVLDSLEESFAPSAPMCHECAFEPYCGSDPVIHHTLYSDFVGFKPTSPFCERTMTIVPRLMDLYQNDDFCRQLFSSWVKP